MKPSVLTLAVVTVCCLALSAGTAERRQLPAPKVTGTVSLEEALAKRRSVRSFQDGRALDMQQISQILWAGQGITGPEKGFRTAPSAGARFPMELYVVTAEGIFHYDPFLNALDIVGKGDYRAQFADASRKQAFIARCSMAVLIAANYDRMRARCGDRTEKFAAMEAGHAAQNMLLEATALGLVSVPVGGVDEPKMRELLHLPAALTPLYTVVVGYPAP